MDLRVDGNADVTGGAYNLGEASTPTIFNLGASVRVTNVYSPMSCAGASMNSAAVSDSDMYKLEGYFCHLFGLTDNMPYTHPYKEFPPLLS